MAQPTNTHDSYDMVGIREDLSDVIHDVSPSETPFYSAAKKVRATNTYHEWQTDALRAAAVNAHIEGDDTITDAVTPTVRLGNYTQIFKNGVTVSGTDEGLTKAGRGKEMAYAILRKAKEQKLDIELAMFANNARVAGSGGVAREMAGLGAWLTTNTVHESGGSGADPTGDGTNARTDDSTPVAFTQARLDTALQTAWENGGNPDTIYLSAYQMDVALGFVGMNNQRATLTADAGKVINSFEVYVTPWGTVKLVPSRHVRSRDVFAVQSDMVKIATLRGTKQSPLAKTGDSTRREIVTELTMEMCNEKAHAAVYDNTAA